MVVDLIGIYVLKGPYCTLTMTDWFLQALSVIPRGSWGDVARRFTMIRWPLLHAPPAAAIDHVIGLVPITSTRRFRPCYYVLTVPVAIFKTSAAPRETGSGSAAAPTDKLYHNNVRRLPDLVYQISADLNTISATLNHANSSRRFRSVSSSCCDLCSVLALMFLS
ncbi:hypothetical protein F511_37333 [Dorcoceras hygrometricum]|uniref:Uncharacterized protein n=1 Tax=Dorcoceras hygrometricum TaxID=472368 RepID=A0A2Z7BVW0_9LAMI|nr:hypothetical protein F511_37333 [Dorcoceras hygrometricum]